MLAIRYDNFDLCTSKNSLSYYYFKIPIIDCIIKEKEDE